MELEEGPLTINGVDLEIFLTPGHSPGSICVYWREKKTLVCGDLIFRESVGRIRFPGRGFGKAQGKYRTDGRAGHRVPPARHMDYVSGQAQVKKNFDVIRRYIFPML